MLSDHSFLKSKSGKGKINLVFDIDGVLAFHSAQLSDTSLAVIEKYGHIIVAAGLAHYVSPGAVELMKLLFSMPYVRVSFFSSGAKSRNVEFVEKLLTLSLGFVRYHAVKNDVIVLSKEDMVYYGNSEQSENITKLCGSLHGNYKKDLSSVLALHPEDSMNDAILIDDDPSYVCLGQHKNILVCHEVQDHHYYSLSNGSCDLSGIYHADSYAGINNIFYVTGLLMKILHDHMTGIKCLSDALFDINYISYESYEQNQKLKYQRGEYICEPIPDPYHSDLQSCWGESILQKNFYETGLKVLRNVNADLLLLDSKIYNSFRSKKSNCCNVH